jgi:uncharacterized protein (TIGR00369 family)
VRTGSQRTSTLAVSEEELQEILSSAAFIKPFGFQLHSNGDAQCSIRVPSQKAFERPNGIISGLVFTASADIAFWFAIKTQLGNADASVTHDLKTTFLGPGKEKDFFCAARIMKLGNRLIYGTAECSNAAGRILTHHTITYVRPGS